MKGCFTNILFVHIPALETHYCILQSGTKRVRRLVPRELGACSQPYNIGVNSCSGDEKKNPLYPRLVFTVANTVVPEEVP